MTRTRLRVRGRRGGELERFAYLPESVMESPALATAPHAALRVLAILLVGKAKERNGTLMCSDSYAARFGMTSHDTLHRSLELLERRSLIVVTRRAQRLRRFASLYAVTWWPVYYFHGQPLPKHEPASHAYLRWLPSEKDHSPRQSGDDTPTIGATPIVLHPDSSPFSGTLHPDYRGNSQSLGHGPRLSGSLGDAILKLMREQPHLQDSDVARACGVEISIVTSMRKRA
jgi:hypothetical protein